MASCVRPAWVITTEFGQRHCLRGVGHSTRAQKLGPKHGAVHLQGPARLQPETSSSRRLPLCRNSQNGIAGSRCLLRCLGQCVLRSSQVCRTWLIRPLRRSLHPSAAVLTYVVALRQLLPGWCIKRLLRSAQIRPLPASVHRMTATPKDRRLLTKGRAPTATLFPATLRIEVQLRCLLAMASLPA